VGRVVFGKNAEPDRWSRLDSLLHDIAADQPSDPSIVPGDPAIDPQDSGFDRSGVAALSSHPEIFQPATEATASWQGGHMAARQEGAFIDPGIADLGAGGAPDAESFPCPLRSLAESTRFIRIQI
jgi:hypothetical protein